MYLRTIDTSDEVEIRYQMPCAPLDQSDWGEHDWQWHIRRIAIYCRIHFQRGIERITGDDRSPSSWWCRMMDVVRADTEEQYHQLLDGIISKSNALFMHHQCIAYTYSI